MAKSGDLRGAEPKLASESNSSESEVDSNFSGVAQMLEPDSKAIISIDFDGPVADQGDGFELEGRKIQEVAEALGYLAELADSDDDIDVVLNSGKPRDYLEKAVEEFSEYDDRISRHGLDLIGGMGTEFRINGGENSLDLDREPMVETQKDIYVEAANHGWSLNIQNNNTGAVWVNRIESEGEKESNPTFSGDKDTEKLWREYLREEDGFEFKEGYERNIGDCDEDGAIVFNEEVGTDALLRLQRQEEEFIGLRFERDRQGNIVFYRQEEDREIDYEEAFDRMAEIVEASDHEWKYNHYDDGGFEVWNPSFCGKGEGLDVYRFVKGLGHRVSMHFGDSSSSDYIESVNSYIVPQRGTDAERDIGDVSQERVIKPEHDVVSLANSIKTTIGDSPNYAEG